MHFYRSFPVVFVYSNNFFLSPLLNDVPLGTGLGGGGNGEKFLEHRLFGDGGQLSSSWCIIIMASPPSVIWWLWYRCDRGVGGGG